MNIVDLPTTLLGWTGVIAAAAAVIVFFLYQLRRNDLKLLRESISDLSERVEFLEHENNRYKEEIVTLTNKFSETKFKKDYLKNIVIQALANKVGVDQTLSKELSAMLKTK